MNIAKNGCQNCRRKTIITMICRCHMIVCITCRHPEDHKCKFDYQKEEKEKLKKDNPVIVSEKLDRV